MSLSKGPLIRTLLVWDWWVRTSSSLSRAQSYPRRKGKGLLLSGFRAGALCAPSEASESIPKRSEPKVEKHVRSQKVKWWNKAVIIIVVVTTVHYSDIHSLMPTCLPHGLSLHLFPHGFTLPQDHFLCPKHPTVFQFLTFVLFLTN